MPRRERSSELMERSRQSLAGGVSSNVRASAQPAPLFFENGEGSRLYDVDGNCYVDYVLGQGPLILGHSPRPVLEAVHRALEKGQLYAAQHELEVTLSEKIQALIPCAELVRYSNSGSEIVQAALRLARAYTQREKVIKFEGHYHGWFDNVLISVHPALDQVGPRTAPQAVRASAGQVSSALDDIIVLPWNDLDLVEGCVKRHRDEIAAVIMEPLMCNTGCIYPREGYLEGVQEICRKNGIILIFDEIITGFRISLRGAQGYFGVTPDLATFGKAMAGGFPISCLAGKRGLMEWIAQGKVNHSGTFNSNVMAIAAALATLDALQEHGVYEQMVAYGQRLSQGLRDVMLEVGIDVKVVGPGPVFHIAFTDGEPVYDYRTFAQHTDMERGRHFAALLLERGVRIIPRGIWYLSRAHMEEDVTFSLAAARSAARELAHG